MTLYGWIFLIVTWSFILWLTIFSVTKVLKHNKD